MPLSTRDFWAQQSAISQGLEAEQLAADQSAQQQQLAPETKPDQREALETYRNLRDQGYEDDAISRAFARHGWAMPATGGGLFGGIGSELVSGVKRGWRSSVGSGIEGLATAAGDPEMFKYGQSWEQSAQDPTLQQAGVPDYTDINKYDGGTVRAANDFLRYGAGMLGSTLPETGVIAGATVGATLAAPAAAPAGAIGLVAGLGAALFPNLGRVAQETVDNGAPLEAVMPGGEAHNRIVGGAAAMSALDVVLGDQIGTMVTRGLKLNNLGAAMRVLKNAAFGFVTEGGTEAMQEAVQIFTANPNVAALLTPEAKHRMVSSLIGGGLAGGVIEGGLTPFEARPPPIAPPAPPGAPPAPPELYGPPEFVGPMPAPPGTPGSLYGPPAERGTAVGPIVPPPGAGTPLGLEGLNQDRARAQAAREGGELFPNIRGPRVAEPPPAGPKMVDLAQGTKDVGILGRQLGLGGLLPQDEQQAPAGLDQGASLHAATMGAIGTPPAPELGTTAAIIAAQQAALGPFGNIPPPRPGPEIGPPVRSLVQIQREDGVGFNEALRRRHAEQQVAQQVAPPAVQEPVSAAAPAPGPAVEAGVTPPAVALPTAEGAPASPLSAAVQQAPLAEPMAPAGSPAPGALPAPAGVPTPVEPLPPAEMAPPAPFTPTHLDTETNQPVMLDEGWQGRPGGGGNVKVRTVRYQDGTEREENARKNADRYRPISAGVVVPAPVEPVPADGVGLASPGAPIAEPAPPSLAGVPAPPPVASEALPQQFGQTEPAGAPTPPAPPSALPASEPERHPMPAGNDVVIAPDPSGGFRTYVESKEGGQALLLGIPKTIEQARAMAAKHAERLVRIRNAEQAPPLPPQGPPAPPSVATTPPVAAKPAEPGIPHGDRLGFPHIGTGMVLRTKSGRHTAPAPTVNLKDNGTIKASRRRMHQWLLAEARKEVAGDQHMTEVLGRVRSHPLLAPADVEMLNDIVFGDTDGAKPGDVVPKGEKAKPVAKVPDISQTDVAPKPAKEPVKEPETGEKPPIVKAKPETPEVLGTPTTQPRTEPERAPAKDTSGTVAKPEPTDLLTPAGPPTAPPLDPLLRQVATVAVDRVVAESTEPAVYADRLRRAADRLRNWTKGDPDEYDAETLTDHLKDAEDAEASADLRQEVTDYLQKPRTGGEIYPERYVAMSNAMADAMDAEAARLDAQAAKYEAARPKSKPAEPLAAPAPAPKPAPTQLVRIRFTGPVGVEQRIEGFDSVEAAWAVTRGPLPAGYTMATVEEKSGKRWKFVSSVGQKAPEAAPPAEPTPAPAHEIPSTKSPDIVQRAPEYGAGNKVVSKDRYELAKQRLRDKFKTQLSSGMDPEIAAEGMLMALYHVEAGARAFGDYAKAVLADLGDGAKPFLSMWYQTARAYPGFDTTGMTPQAEVDAAIAKGMVDQWLAEATAPAATGVISPPATEPTNAPAVPEGAAPDNRPSDAGSGAETVQPSGAAEPPGTGDNRPGDSGERGAGDGDRNAGEPLRPSGEGGIGGGDVAGDQGGVGTGVRGGAGVPAGGRGRGRRGGGRGAAAGTGVPNYLAPPGALTREGSWYATAARNLDAMELVNRLEAEGRQATPAEQEQLSKFTGWGASEIANKLFPAQAVVRSKDAPTYLNADHWAYNEPRWKELAERAATLLKGPDLEQAARSTQYAHYTSEPVIRGMWQAMEHFGFDGGRILEPGMGIGLFPVLAPAEIMNNSPYTGIEFDKFTAAVAKNLLPNSNVIHGDYIKQALPDGFFDVAIGNPPFKSGAITEDPAYRRYRFSLHDYFFAKSLDKVRPGGILAFVTSRYSMDKLDTKARQYLADRADLLGAIRLPKTAFMANAGTEVVTDVIFLRKRQPGEAPGGEAWIGHKGVSPDEISGPILINEYFVDHPEMVLGTHTRTGSMYGAKEYSVDPIEGDIGEQFAAAVAKLPADVYQEAATTADDETRTNTVERDFSVTGKKEGQLYLDDNGILSRFDRGSGVKLADVEELKPAEAAWLGGAVKIKDLIKEAQQAQLTNADDWEDKLKALNKAYDKFVKAHGPIQANKPTNYTRTNEDGEEFTYTVRRYTNNKLWNLDVEGQLLTGLEHVDDDGKVTKAPFLTERTLKKPQRPDIKTTQDAFMVSMDERGRLDLDHIAQLRDMSREEVIEQLGAGVYETPQGVWQTDDEYLSGNVREKLAEAQTAAAADPRFDRNVEALLARQPSPLTAERIDINLGAGWVPPTVVDKFATEVLEQDFGDGGTRYDPLAARWDVPGSEARPRRGGYVQAATEWSTPQRPAAVILESVLNNKPIKITYKTKEGEVFDEKQSAQANDIAKKMKAKFKSWVWTDVDRASQLLGIYNESFNNFAPREFDGSHLTLPGLTTRLQGKLHPHQKRAVWRVIQTGNTYLAHAVGAGKTLEMIISAMEQRRLGLVKKPMFVVPKHMLNQFASEFMDAYPAAKIMVADDLNFVTTNRQRFIAQASMNDLDGIIIPHSSFGKLGTKAETRARIINKMLAELQIALESFGDDNSSRIARKKIEKQIEALEQKLLTATTQEGKDTGVLFEDMGVDMLYVDEAHEFRKLDYATERQVKGIDPKGSARALDLFVKTRWLDAQRPGRSMVFASGTPVTNTLAELYTVQRYLDEGQLEKDGVAAFDAWATQFGEIVTDTEQTADGSYEDVSRFADLLNVPELMKRVRNFMDVLTASQLKGVVSLPEVEGGAPINMVQPPTPQQVAYMREVLGPRIKASREWKPSREQPGNPDPMIAIITDGQLSAIDMRFVDRGSPNDPRSKLNRMIDEIIAHHGELKNDVYLDADGKPEPTKGSAQIVYSAIGFGEGAQENRGFDLRGWMMRRFAKAGIKPSEVAWMSDYKKDAKKQQLFKEVRSGQKRILIGSPKNMGTGLNVQRRLKALHYLTPPWYPADVEQPQGRIIRQGNANKEVVIKWYASKGSYDSAKWGMVARKGRFIERAFLGDDSIRRLSDISEVSQYQMASAMAAGDERAIMVANLSTEIGKLDLLQSAHHSDQQSLKGKRTQIESGIKQRAATIERYKEAEKIGGGKYVATPEMTVGGIDYDSHKALGEALLAQSESRALQWTPRNKEDKQTHKLGDFLGKYPVTLKLYPTTQQRWVEKREDTGTAGWKDFKTIGMALTMAAGPVSHQIGPSIFLTDLKEANPTALAKDMQNWVNGLSRERQSLQREQTEAEKDLAAIKARIGAPFEYANELAAKTAERAQLLAELTKGGVIEEGETDFGLELRDQIEGWEGEGGFVPADPYDQTEIPPMYSPIGRDPISILENEGGLIPADPDEPGHLAAKREPLPPAPKLATAKPKAIGKQKRPTIAQIAAASDGKVVIVAPKGAKLRGEGLTPRAAKQQDSLIKLARSVVQQINPRQATEFADRIFGSGAALAESTGSASMERVAGYYDSDRALIRIALDQSPDQAMRTAAHEAWHSIESLLTADETAKLHAAYPGKGKQTATEATAYAFEDWASDKFAAKHQPWAKAIFAKVARFVRALGQALRGRGFTTPERIFAKAIEGKIAARGEAAPTGKGVQFARGAGVPFTHRGYGAGKATEGLRGPNEADIRRIIQDSAFKEARVIFRPDGSFEAAWPSEGGTHHEVANTLGAVAGIERDGITALATLKDGKLLYEPTMDFGSMKRMPLDEYQRTYMAGNARNVLDYDGRKVWSVVVDSKTGKPLHGVLYEDAADADFHHSMYLPERYQNAIERGTARLVWEDRGDLHSMEPLARDFKETVQSYLGLNAPSSGVQFRGARPAGMPDYVADPKPAWGVESVYDATRSVFLDKDARHRVWLDFRKATQDSLIYLEDLGLRRARERLGQDFLPIPANSGVKLAKMAADDGGRMSMALESAAPLWDAKHGITKPHPKIGGLKWVAESLKTPEDYADATAYVYALRASRLIGEERENLMTEADIAAGLARGTPAAKQFAERWDKFNEATLQFAVDTGVLSPEQKAAYRAHFYVPFYRMYEETGELMGPSELRQGLNNPSLRIKRLKGGTAPLGDLFENIVKNTATIMSAGVRNVAHQQIYTELKDMGETTDVPAGQPNKGDDVVSFYDEGKRKFHKPDDAQMFATLSGMRPETLNGIIRGLHKFSSIYRRAVTASPPFMLRNWIRGVVGTWVQTGRSISTTANSFTEIKAFAQNDPLVDQIRAATGFGAYAFGEQGGMSGAHLRRLTFEEKKGLKGLPGKVWDFWEKVGEATEMADRMALARNLMAQGIDEGEALYQAQNVMPYGTHGAAPWMRFLTMTVPFMNARIQGLARMLDKTSSVDEKGRLAKRLILRGLIVAGLTAGLWALNNWDEDKKRKYDALTPDQRLVYWPLIFGDTMVMIPKPFEFGHIFATSVEMGLDAMTKDTGVRDARVLAVMAGQQTFGFDTYLPVPQAILPAAEVATNWDFFRQRPVENLGVSRLPPEQRTGPNVSSVAEGLAQIIPGNLSPLQIEHLIDGYGGVMGKIVTAGVDAFAGNVGLIPQRPSGVFGSSIPGEFASVLGLESLVKNADVPLWNRWVEDFYNVKTLADQQYSGARAYALQGRINDARDLIKEDPALYRMRPVLNAAEAQLSKVSQAMRQIRGSTLAPDEKRRRLDQLVRARNDTAERIMRVYNRLEAGAGQRAA